MKRSKYYFSSRITMVISTVLTIAIFSQAAQGAQGAQAICNECGTVTDVKTIKIEGQGSGVGAVTGGVLGGVVGHQVGGGRGQDLATIGGLVGGAYVGHQVEKKSKSGIRYHVLVEMEDGSSKTFKYSSRTSYQVGDRVKVKNGKLTRA
ncbi:glycine zipper 2TM domain-containing protein [Candidatus Nitrotoga arctica]|uniref:Glycine zipper 2TM domain-containing protein n=1 Tax=Candidatus Nitrotoga arctica TaxID=453162 RepID=A0ABM8Z085_9PROT|nr:glycine zipper 2TM domain-containing protein [Candidatus Nitrotoga arctica]CAG9933219.1 Glycine zipper 2TM domain-containing protein [Candidatus Nitrotoga arctica]